MNFLIRPFTRHLGCPALLIILCHSMLIGAEKPVAESTFSTTTTSILLREVVVTAARDRTSSTPIHGGDTSELLEGWAGVALQQNGAASLPILHGLGDERVKILVDGMTITSACPNHMNPPLSYISPGQVEKVEVLAGITPVSQGGDSLGGTIIVNSARPLFASPEQKIHTATTLNSYYGTNGDSYGGSLNSAVANQNFSLGYRGAYSQAGDYKDGNGNTVTSTFYETSTQAVTFATQKDGHFSEITAGLNSTPKEGFVNQWMDVTRNDGEFINTRYEGQYDWGQLDTRAYWQQVTHGMNISKDKESFPMPMWMPMDTHGINTGYTLKATIPILDLHTLRVGNEFHRFELDDTWPQVPGSGMMMSPNTFVNINNGERNRLAFFAEWETQYNEQWMTLFGARNDTVWMDTGNVQGYSAMYAADANAFNSRDHARTDVNFDLTALTRYEPEKSSTYEIGYARKSRAPSLYERYAWSKVKMAAEMVNWFGDGNYYTGNLDLKSEVAHTFSITANWHDDARKDWEVAVTPYYSYVEDYINVDRFGTVYSGQSIRSQLIFANHDAQLYGVDLKWKKQLWNNDTFGHGQIRGVAGWVRGETLDGNDLYHMMPLHATVALEETLGRWTSAIEVQMIDSKAEVDGLRNEPTTPGYALLNLRTGYQWPNVRLNAGIDNVIDKFYYQPLGGVNFDNFQASNYNAPLQSVAGAGRTFYTSLTIQF